MRLIQKLAINGADLSPDLIVNAVYIESLLLDGPQLMLTLADEHKDLRDEAKIAIGDKISCSIGEDARGRQLYAENFIIGACGSTPDGQNMMIEAMAEPVYRLKTLFTRPRFFVDRTISYILSELVGGPITGPVPDGYGTYHGNIGSTPSVLIEQICHDYGVLLWYAKGKFHCQQITSFSNQAPELQFDYMVSGTENPLIDRYTKYDARNWQKRKRERGYWSWDIKTGVVDNNCQGPAHYCAGVPEQLLSNRQHFLIPIAEYMMRGNSNIFAGTRITAVLHSDTDNGRPIDESLPAQQTITAVRHQQRGTDYIMAVEVAV